MLDDEVSADFSGSPATRWVAPSTAWKRLFPHSTQETLKNAAQKKKKKDVEWISDLFKATLFTEQTSFSQLRTCQLSSKQTQTLATLIPDEIIYFNDLRNKKTLSYVGVLLFADVSGFTALCEKYNTSGKGGTYRLTATLNSYIGAMVEVIYSHGGDVLKFSGDAFLAVWKMSHEDFIFQIIHKTIVCALFIQQTLGSYETDVKVLLRVKIAISAGNMIFSVIGDELCKYYIICGTPVDDVKAAEHACGSGDVVLSESAWGHCSAHNYEFTHKDSHHVKVTGIVYNPGGVRKEMMPRFPPLRVLLESKQNHSERQAEASVSSISIRLDGNERRSVFPRSILRPSVGEACKLKLGSVLRPFVIPPVVQQVDADQPLEYLTEMRQVTIMFINLVPQEVSHKLLIHMVDEAYTTIYRIVRSSLGCVNKVTMFDKDIAFLVIFGLRKCKHESESQNGLRCAYNVWKSLKDLKSAKSTSIGVTTGMVYCGVVGHNLRREYTVIGGPVNKAARIMCAYPGRVTCDHNTFLHSKLSPDNFELQEIIELKGIDVVGHIYKYTEEERDESLNSLEYPLLGRNKIITMFENMMVQWKEGTEYHSLVIQGDSQVGKSRILNELVKNSLKHNFLPISISLSSFHLTTSFLAIYQIFKQILGLSDIATMRDRAECIIRRMGDRIPESELCYLNDILQVKFPHSAQYLGESTLSRQSALARNLQAIIDENSQKILIAADNAHFIDTQSWRILTDLVLTNTIMVAATMYSGRRAISIDAAQTLLKSEKVIIMQLEGLDSHYMAPLACQFLNVKAISPDLEGLLKNYGGGNPGWCQNFLTSLLRTGSLQIREISETEAKERLLVRPETALVRKSSAPEGISQDTQKPVSPTESRKYDNRKRMEECLTDPKVPVAKIKKIVSSSESEITVVSRNTVHACIIPSRFNINKDSIPETIDAMIMTVFDSLIPYEQILLKCASVLGDIFTRKMLVALMHKPSAYQTAQAIKRLYDMQVLDCAITNSRGVHQYSIFIRKTTQSFHASSHALLNCSCPEYANAELRKEFPKYAFCQVLHFRIPLFRITTYELLPNNQKRDFHTRAVRFLENEDHKCIACGGRNFLRISSEEDGNQGKRGTFVIEDPLVLGSRTSDNTSNSSGFQDRGEYHKKLSERTVSLNSQFSCAESEAHSFFTDMPKPRDFRNCECPFIQYDAYQQLVHHCASAENKLKHIKYLIEQGAVSITIGNNTQAINLLNKAKYLTENEIEDSETLRSTNRFDLARINMLLGQAYLDLGNLDDAKAHLHMSIHKFGGFFPKSKLTAHMLLHWQYYRLAFRRRFSSAFTSSGHNIICREKASTFSHLTNVYMMEQDWLLAELAAVMSLNLAQRSNDLYELCEAYSNMMEICHHHGRLKYNRKLEDTALNAVKCLYTGSEAKELLAVCHLFWATSVSRLLRGELESSIKTGFMTVKISDHVSSSYVKLTVLPALIQALIMNDGLHEAVDLLKILLFESQEDVDKSSQIWYYALCLDILLDTGFTVESATACAAYAQDLVIKQDESFSLSVLRDKASLQRLVACMWVWYTRLHKEEDSHLWANIAAQYIHIEDDESFSNLISALRYLEGLLLCTVIVKTQQEQFRYLRFTAATVIKKLEKIAETVAIIQPRLLHLKAYYFCTQNNKVKALELLKEAWHKADQQKNKLEVGWITHSFKLWNGIINAVDEQMWKDNNAHSHNIDWHEYTLQTVSHMTYSLPRPTHSF